MRKLLAIAGLLLMTGCATSSYSPDPADIYESLPGPTPIKEPKSRIGNKPTYTVWGKQYHVLDKADNFTEQGIASWYGKKFHGRKTANGEVYDMYQMTAAHKHLPLPSYVLVTNKDNGKRAVVRVNDRGPFHGDRVIDLSYAAAKSLGFAEKGLANVKVEVISPDTSPGATTEKRAADPLDLERRWLPVQVLVTHDLAKARQIQAQLSSELTHPVSVDRRPLSSKVTVRVGPVRGIANAKLLSEQLQAMGYEDAFVAR